jgi:hypothetical protein
LFVKGVNRSIVRQVEVQRRDRDIAIRHRLKVRLVARGFDHRAEAEPIIIVTSWVGALNDTQPAIVAQALAADADAADLVRMHCGEIHVDESARFHRELEQRCKHPPGPFLGRREGNGVTHALPRISLAEGDRRHSIAAETVPE